MRAFVIRPFGTRKGIDFDGVEKNLVGPALENIALKAELLAKFLRLGTSV
jgi:hypothetical protein